MNRHLYKVFSALMLSVVVVACQNSKKGEVSGPPANTPRQPVFVYECENDYTFVVSIKDETAWLFLPEETVALPSVPSSSGTRYGKDNLSFWKEGENAILETGSETIEGCFINRLRSVWESAKFAGIDFRAVGNEPGWHLEITMGEKIVLIVSYGSIRYEFDTPEPTSDQTARTSRFVAEDDQHSIEVFIEGTRCADTMSDETFESTVTVTLDERVYRGCGRSLH